MKLTNQEEQLVEIINDFFGCDASYYGVHPLDLAKHLIANRVSLPHRDCYNCSHGEDKDNYCDGCYQGTSEPTKWVPSDSCEPDTMFEQFRHMSKEELLNKVGPFGLCEFIQYYYNEHCEKREYCGNCLAEFLDSRYSKKEG